MSIPRPVVCCWDGRHKDSTPASVALLTTAGSEGGPGLLFKREGGGGGVLHPHPPSGAQFSEAPKKSLIGQRLGTKCGPIF